jgi:hypothetical protein
LERRLENELEPGERLLWSGRPRRGLPFERYDGCLVPFSFLWYGIVTAAAIKTVRGGDWGFDVLLAPPLYIMILLLSIAIWLLPGRFVVDVWRRIRTSYGLTDRRALIVDGLVRRRVRSLPLATLSWVELTHHGDGSGTVAFSPERHYVSDGRAGPPAFVMVKGVQRAYDLLVAARADVFSAQGSNPTMRHWDLSAPASAVLLWGPEVAERRVLTLAIRELIAAGTLVVVDGTTYGLWGRSAVGLAWSGRPVPPLGRSLRAVWDACSAIPYEGTGVPVRRLAYAVFGRGPGYVQGEVLPELEGRGLYTRERHKRLGVIPTTRWVLTPEGAALRADLIARMAIGQGRFGGWVATDPGTARDFVAAAGPSFLLVSSLWPEVRHLRWALTRRGDTESAEDAVAARRLNGRDRDDRPRPAGPAAGTAELDPLEALDVAVRAEIDEDVDRAHRAVHTSDGGRGG